MKKDEALLKTFNAMAEQAIEDAECGAQLQIRDKELRRSLLISIRQQLEKVYKLGSSK